MTTYLKISSPRCRPIISNVCTEIIQIWTTASRASSHSAPQSTGRVVPWRAAHLHVSVPLHELLVLPRISKAFDPSSPGWLLSSLRKLNLSFPDHFFFNHYTGVPVGVPSVLPYLLGLNSITALLTVWVLGCPSFIKWAPEERHWLA